MFTIIVHYRRTYWACEHSDDWSMSSLCVQWIAKDLSFLQPDCKDWSDWAFTQADTLRLHKLNHITLCLTVIWVSPKQTVLIYRINIQKTTMFKNKCVTLGKFRNIHSPMKLSMYQSNSVTLAPLEINSTLMLKTKVVCNLNFICFMHIFVHFSIITYTTGT